MPHHSDGCAPRTVRSTFGGGSSLSNAHQCRLRRRTFHTCFRHTSAARGPSRALEKRWRPCDSRKTTSKDVRCTPTRWAASFFSLAACPELLLRRRTHWGREIGPCFRKLRGTTDTLPVGWRCRPRTWTRVARGRLGSTFDEGSLHHVLHMATLVLAVCV